MDNQLDRLANELRGALIQDVQRYLTGSGGFLVKRLVELALWLPAQRIARLAAGFDEQVGRSGFCGASRWVLPRLVQAVDACGSEIIPPSGPLIIAANHPGTYDAVAIAASIPRVDFKTIARKMPFLEGMQCTRRCMIFSSRDVRVKMSAARAALEHLRNGGMLLLFPSGDMDPDPAHHGQEARMALSKWSPSLELLLRKVPDAQLQIAFVSGLMDPRYLNHPAVRFRKSSHQRQIAAEILQVMDQMVFQHPSTQTPRLTFGKPVLAGELLAGGPSRLMPAILHSALGLLDAHLGAGRPAALLTSNL